MTFSKELLPKGAAAVITENRETNRNNDKGKMWPAMYVPLVFVFFGCTLCQDFVTACAQASLNLSMGLDFSRNKLPRYQREKKKEQELAA
ncbi:MAG: hypothetical protein JRD68_12645 [Deltaproteobacteria bacterium]|nr:hypothetical protein [Deltaproteobacteria bacterium]